MRTWKAEARRQDGLGASKWGYVRAHTEEEALAICKASSGLPINRIFRKPDGMLWPGIRELNYDWQ